MAKDKILIVDDEEVNRDLLAMMFDEEYDIVYAANGIEAIDQIDRLNDGTLALILLDIVMPALDGFGVLDYMKAHDLIDSIPVILITSETIRDSEDRAYSYGIADVIHKPFYPDIVQRRGQNIIDLYHNKRDMQAKLADQEHTIRDQERKIQENNDFMIEALSDVVEFRSAETGDHVRRIKYFTRILLKYLTKYFPKYGITDRQVDEIARASALHDIGKIAIPDAILLKPARLTPEEMETMKTHTVKGCEILESFSKVYTGEFYQYCYDICRYHHERYDGKGYPDGLKGEDNPIYAQIVGIADVYDALVSKRVYKDAYANTDAYKMIMNGECGVFAPDALECFQLAKEDFFNIVSVIQMFTFE